MKTLHPSTGSHSQRDVFCFFIKIASNLNTIIDFYKDRVEGALMANLKLRTHKVHLGNKMMDVFDGFEAEDIDKNRANLKELITSMDDEIRKIPLDDINVGDIAMASEAFSLALTSTMFRLSQAKEWLRKKKIDEEEIDGFFEEYEHLFVFYGLARACYDIDFSIVKFDPNGSDELVLNIMYGIFFGADLKQDKTFDILSWIGTTNSSDKTVLTCDALVNWVNFNIDKYKVQDLAKTSTITAFMC